MEAASINDNELSDKLAFAAKACSDASSFDGRKPRLPAETMESLEWVTSRSHNEIRHFRESRLAQLRRRIDPTAISRWFERCDPAIRKMTAHRINGPLLKSLAIEYGFVDVECVEFFRKGADIVGKIQHKSNKELGT